MSGFYRQSPLVYVVAKLNFAAQDIFTDEDRAIIRKLMIKRGLVEYCISIAQQFELNPAAFSPSNETVPARKRELKRYGYFSDERTECVLLSEEGFEYRTTNYSYFTEFKARLLQLIGDLTANVVVLQQLKLNEVLLSYSDVVVPAKGRELHDYFATGQACLPASSFLQNDSSVAVSGKSQWTKLLDKQTRVTGTIEQLPQKVLRLLVENATEHDNQLAMPIRLSAAPQADSDEAYALVFTETSRLVGQTLVQSDLNGLLDNVHDYCKRAFSEMLNDEVCDKDWQYQEKK